MQPVDPVALKIPDYPTVVKNPMDLSTVERKLNNLEYDTVDDFVQDVNLIFANCYLYNGRESPIAIFASNLESAFTSSLRYMPKEVGLISLALFFSIAIHFDGYEACRIGVVMTYFNMFVICRPL